jgi:hypothetical protein
MIYNIFVGCAMAHDTRQLKEIQSFVEMLEKEFGDIYFAPKKYPDPKLYPKPKEAFKEIFHSINNSEIFFLYYPEKVVSGSLTELGLALGLGKRCFIYTESLDNLSYMLREDLGMDMMILTQSTWQQDFIKEYEKIYYGE